MNPKFLLALVLWSGLMACFYPIGYAQTQMDDSFFAKVKPEIVEMEGFRFKSPLFYYDNIQMSAAFCAPVDKVKALLPSDELELVLVKPDTTIVVMAASQFRRIDGMKPYNQFGIFIPVIYKPAHSPGMPGYFVSDMPASSEEAVKSGAEIYGLPKFWAEITFEESDTERHCHVKADGKDIITFSVKKIATKLRPLETYCYSAKKDILFGYRLQSLGYWEVSDNPNGSSYILGDHPVSEKWKSLHIAPNPISSFYSPQLQSLLYKPDEIGQIKIPPLEPDKQKSQRR